MDQSDKAHRVSLKQCPQDLGAFNKFQPPLGTGNLVCDLWLKGHHIGEVLQCPLVAQKFH